MFGREKNDNNLEFFTVYDSKAQMYAEPFPALNHLVVLRDFTNAFSDKEAAAKNRYFKNAEDFSVFRIGTFDQKSGKFSSQNPEHIANLHDIRATLQQGALDLLD